MALVPLSNVIAMNVPVDPLTANDPAIVQGMLVGLTSAGYAKKADGSAALTTFGNAIGIAADSTGTTGTNANGDGTTKPNSAYGASIVINGNGNTRVSQNRVSDYFNETASGKISVYIAGGEFLTDQYTSTFTVGCAVYSSSAGLFQSSASGPVVGRCIATPAAYPSGVPGSLNPTANGSMSLGTFLRVVSLL